MKAELSFVSLFVAAILMKSFHIPGGNILLVLTLTLLVLFWMGGGFYFFAVKGESCPTWLSALTGLAFGPATVGVMFKIQIWPGANAMLLMGIIVSALALVVIIVMKQQKNADAPVYFKRMIVRAALVAGFSTFLVLTPSKSLFAFFHRGNDALIEKFNYMVDHPEDEEALRAYQEQRNRGIAPPQE